MAANNGDGGIRIVDFRSDTVTKPSAQMRQAMAAAEVGDDVLREDTTVLELERRCAEMMGKESSLFTPSGTMSNLISVMNHCQERGVEVIIGKDSHINRYEQGGMAQIAGVYPKVLKNLPDGTLDLSQLLDNICLDADVHYSQTRLICIENTHNYCGGRVLTLEYMKRVYEAAQLQGIKVHLDGARLLNASLALNVPPAEITQYCDSVSMCFSKGIGAPVGSILAGTESFITRALRLRKVLGGGMRQVGVLAAAALVGLDEAPSKMAKDHKHARMIAEALHKNGHGIVSVDPSVVQSNIIMVDVVKDNLTSKDLCHRMFQTPPEEVRILGKKITVKISPRDSHTLRMVTNCDVSEDDIKNTIEKFGYVLKELAS